jgi:hypothetical protein
MPNLNPCKPMEQSPISAASKSGRDDKLAGIGWTR